MGASILRIEAFPRPQRGFSQGSYFALRASSACCRELAPHLFLRPSAQNLQVFEGALPATFKRIAAPQERNAHFPAMRKRTSESLDIDSASQLARKQPQVPADDLAGVDTLLRLSGCQLAAVDSLLSVSASVGTLVMWQVWIQSQRFSA